MSNRRTLTRWDPGQLNELNSILNTLQGRVETLEGASGEALVLGNQRIEGKLRLGELATADIPRVTDLGALYTRTNYEKQTELWGVEFDGAIGRRLRLQQRAFEDAVLVGKASDWSFTRGLDLSLDRAADVLSIAVDESELDHGLLSGLDDNDHSAYHAKHGFEVDSDGGRLVSLSYDNATRKVTVSPTGTSFKFWIDGQLFTKSSAETTAAHADATDVYFITYDANGDLQVSATPWSIVDRTATPVAVVYYYQPLSDGVCFYECHTEDRNLEIHQNLHFSRGTQYISGGDISGYTLNTDSDAAVTFAIATARIADEDITTDTTALADGGPYTIFSRTGASGDWTWTDTEVFPFESGTTYPQWNEWTGATWQLTELSGAAGQFINYFVLAVPAIDAVHQIVMIPGQEVFSTQAAAESSSIGDLDLGTAAQFPFQEIRGLWKFVLSPRTSYGGTHKCKILSIQSIKDDNVLSSVSGAAVTDHGALSGLADDDHVQYLLVDGSRDFTGDLLPATDSTLDIGATGEVLAEVWTDKVASDGYIEKNESAHFIDLPLRAPDGRIVCVEDDFVHTTVTSGSIGTLNWSVGGQAGYTFGASTGNTDHPGLVRLKPDNDTGDANYLYSNATVYPLLQGIEEYWQTWILLDNNTLGEVNTIVGISSTIDYAAGTDGIYFYVDYSADNQWQARTIASSTATDTDTGVTLSNSWVRLDIHYTPTSVAFYIDKVLVATHTTNIPTGDMQPVLAVECDATGNGQALSNVFLDYYALTYKVDR